MFVKLRLEPIDAYLEDGNPRKIFWDNIREFDAGLATRAARDREPREAVSDDEFELRLHLHFGRELGDLLKTRIPQLSSGSSFSRIIPGSSSRQFSIEVASISYGSIDFFLNIFGVTTEALQQQVLAALLIFGPAAFQQAVGVKVPLSADVETLSDDKKRKGVGSWQLWAIANGSLLLPFGLAFYILYVAFAAVTEEKKSLAAERAKTFDAIVEQNTKLSAAIVAQSSGLATSAKSMEELQSSLVRALAKAMRLQLPENSTGKLPGDDKNPNNPIQSK